MLRIDRVSKHFGGVQALRNCSFEIPAGEITALIGPNGAGKTTLFNIMNGFVPADAGRVLLDGADLMAFGVWQRSRSGISRTFQIARTFRNLTLRDNLELAIRQNDHLFWHSLFRPAKDDLDERIREKLAFVGLEKDLSAPITALSYGEQKLFDLARALLNPHRLLLLDEPVAGVNPVLRNKLRDILQNLRRDGETILLIEHDMDFVRQVADRVIVMDQGGVLKEGEPEEVLRDSRVLEAYLGKS